MKTITGRVVYDRPRHFFSGRDLARIARAMPPPDTLKDGLGRVDALVEIFTDLLRGILFSFGFLGSQFEMPLLGLAMRVLQAVADSYDISAEKRDRILQALSLLY